MKMRDFSDKIEGFIFRIGTETLIDVRKGYKFPCRLSILHTQLLTEK